MPERTGIVTRAGHICMICGFLPSTKNKYRELQDHLVRKHFNDRIKAVLPIKRPYVCPEPNCSIEGKDWQALMRHYTGKHGILEGFLREVIESGLTIPPDPRQIKRRKQSKLQFSHKSLASRKQTSFTSVHSNFNEQVYFPHSGCNNRSQNMGKSRPVLEKDDEKRLRTQKRKVHDSDFCQNLESNHKISQSNENKQQLALIVKRHKPNGEEQIAMIDLKCFLASSTFVPNNEYDLISTVTASKANFNVLVDAEKNLCPINSNCNNILTHAKSCRSSISLQKQPESETNHVMLHVQENHTENNSVTNGEIFTLSNCKGQQNIGQCQKLLYQEQLDTNKNEAKMDVKFEESIQPEEIYFIEDSSSFVETVNEINVANFGCVPNIPLYMTQEEIIQLPSTSKGGISFITSPNTEYHTIQNFQSKDEHGFTEQLYFPSEYTSNVQYFTEKPIKTMTKDNLYHFQDTDVQEDNLSLPLLNCIESERVVVETVPELNLDDITRKVTNAGQKRNINSLPETSKQQELSFGML